MAEGGLNWPATEQIALGAGRVRGSIGRAALHLGRVACHQPVEFIEAKIVFAGGGAAVTIRVVTRTIEQRGAAGRLADMRPQLLDDVGGGATQPGKTGMDKVIGSLGARIERRTRHSEDLPALFLRQPGRNQRDGLAGCLDHDDAE